MSSVEEAMAAGTQHHRSGQFAEAERAYRYVLNADPNHAHAWHQLGLLAMQSRQFSMAADFIGRAIKINRNEGAFHANLGETFRHMGRAAEAEECYRHALKLQPELVQIHTALGILLHDQKKLADAEVALREAIRLRPDESVARTRLGHLLDEQGRFAESEACFRRVARTDANSADAHFNLASALQSLNRLNEAAASYRRAIELKPDHVEAHNNLGTIYKDLGQLAEADRHYRAALAVRGDYLATLLNLGILLQSQMRYADAEARFRAALATDPNSALAHHSLGTSLQKQGRWAEAFACYQEALRHDPNHAAAYLCLGYIHQMRGHLKESIECCEAAVRINPNSPEAYVNMSVAWTSDGRHDESIECCHKAIAVQPDFSWAHCNLAISLQALGRLDEAFEHHRRGIASDPTSSGKHSNLLYALNYSPDQSPAAIFAEHRAWGQRHADPLTARALPHTNPREPGRRLRIGYVSPHFVSHAVNFFSEPILASHDHTQFEVFCYSDAEQEDDTTLRLRGYADHWRHTTYETDEQLVSRIRQDGIDILVDLTGHINGGRRMLVFAHKPAPIQVTYLGYQNTTGMQAMDYRLTDDYSDPPGLTDAWHTEKLVRLPNTFFCYLPSDYAPPVTDLPLDRQSFVTFGSINNFTKVTPRVIATWATMMQHVPGSRLIVRADMTKSLSADLLAAFAAHGVEAERLELVNRLKRLAYLELINRLDIALDPFPFNGHTTTCDCLWQGVPVITLSGHTYVSRFGGSALATLGLEELITRSEDSYIDVGVELANDANRLREYRSTLRPRMAASPLLDFATFTRNLEAAYRKMWLDWCAAQANAQAS